MFSLWPISDMVINKSELRSSLTRLRTPALDKGKFVLIFTFILYSYLLTELHTYYGSILHMEVLYLSKD
jgi:hypothetical protein